MRQAFATVRPIVRDIIAGQFRIPPVQRTWVWTDEQVLALLDSLLHGHHIGTIFAWERYQQPAAKVRLADVEIDSPAGGGLLVFDGQQRIGALATAFLSGRFYVDLWEGTFTTTPKPTDFPLALLHTEDYGAAMSRWVKALSDHSREWGLLAAVMNDALSYGVQVHFAVVDHRMPLSYVVETYRRLNSTGTAMSPDDLAASLARYEQMANEVNP